MTQGDLSVDAYAQQMKQTADAMREVGNTISPSQLVLNLLRGINPRFANTADIIANTSPLPDFKAATNMLHVKELRLGNEGKEASRSLPSPTPPTPHLLASLPSLRPPIAVLVARARGVRAKVAAAATATTAEGAISRTSSSVAPNRAPPVGAKLLHRPALCSATLLGPASGHRNTSSSSGGAISTSPTASTSASGSHRVRAAPVLCTACVRVLGSDQPDCRPQPDGTSRGQSLGHGQRSDSSHDLQ